MEIKKLSYIEYKEVNDLDNIIVNYPSYSQEEENIETHVFQKKIICNSVELDDINLLEDLVEKQFISKIKSELNKEHIISLNRKIIDSDSLDMNIIEETFNSFKKPCFVFVSEDMKEHKLIKLIPGNYIKVSNHLDNNEIIFGRKARCSSGFYLSSNDKGLSNIKNIRYAIYDVGLNPIENYYLIKIK